MLGCRIALAENRFPLLGRDALARWHCAAASGTAEKSGGYRLIAQ